MTDEFPWLQRQLEQDLLSDRPSRALTSAEMAAFAAITAGQQILPWADRLQAQGDLLVLPWPVDIDPLRRMGVLASARSLPPEGVHLANGSHQLQALDPGVRWAPEPAAARLTLGTVVVPDGCLALLGHGTHADLFLGPGVYLIRRQRQARVPEPQAQAVPSTDRRRPERQSLLSLLWDVVVD